MRRRSNSRIDQSPKSSKGPSRFRSITRAASSVPDQFAEVERPASIRASWLDREGRIHEQTLDGLLATCLQHEMDHLNGVLFIDHLSRLKCDMLLKKLEEARRAV